MPVKNREPELGGSVFGTEIHPDTALAEIGMVVAITLHPDIHLGAAGFKIDEFHGSLFLNTIDVTGEDE